MSANPGPGNGRIAHVSHFLSPKRGGVESYIDNASLAFAALGHDVEQIGPAYARDRPRSANPLLRDPRVVQYRFPELTTTRSKNPATAHIPRFLTARNDRDVAFYKSALGPMINHLAPEFVFAHMVGPSLAQALLELAPHSRCYFLPHIPYLQTGEERPLAMKEAIELDGWHAVLSQADWHTGHILDVASPSAPVLCVPPPTDIPTFANPARHGRIDDMRKPGELWLLSPSRINDWKGQTDLVRSLPYFLDKGVDIHLVIPASDEFARLTSSGSDDEIALRKLVNDMGLHDRVHFMELSGPTMAQAMHSVDVVVVTSRQGNGLMGENACTVATETLATGTPLAITKWGGPAGYMKDGYNGATIDISDDPTVVPADRIFDAVMRAHAQRDQFAVTGPRTAALYSPEVFTDKMSRAMGLARIPAFELDSL